MCVSGVPRLPFMEVRVVNDNGEAPWDGTTLGELHVRGPWAAASYFNAPGTEDRWTADGWLRTGDIATIDGEGYVHIADRAKDLIKLAGNGSVRSIWKMLWWRIRRYVKRG